MMSPLYPTRLELRGGTTLMMYWSDGTAREYAAAELRDACPCATCREKRLAPPEPAGLLPVLSLEEARPLRVLEMTPVGNYAYSIRFSDAHDTGIYSLDQLYTLGRESTL